MYYKLKKYKMKLSTIELILILFIPFGMFIWLLYYTTLKPKHTPEEKSTPAEPDWFPDQPV